MLVKSDGAVEISSHTGSKPPFVAVNPDGSLFRYENPIDSILIATPSFTVQLAITSHMIASLAAPTKRHFACTPTTPEGRDCDRRSLRNWYKTPLKFFSSANAELRIKEATNNSLSKVKAMLTASNPQLSASYRHLIGTSPPTLRHLFGGCFLVSSKFRF
jgi:hypothetical protein